MTPMTPEQRAERNRLDKLISEIDLIDYGKLFTKMTLAPMSPNMVVCYDHDSAVRHWREWQKLVDLHIDPARKQGPKYTMLTCGSWVEFVSAQGDAWQVRGKLVNYAQRERRAEWTPVMDELVARLQYTGAWKSVQLPAAREELRQLGVVLVEEKGGPKP